jgi:hypothetical protein
MHSLTLGQTKGHRAQPTRNAHSSSRLGDLGLHGRGNRRRSDRGFTDCPSCRRGQRTLAGLASVAAGCGAPRRLPLLRASERPASGAPGGGHLLVRQRRQVYTPRRVVGTQGGVPFSVCMRSPGLPSLPTRRSASYLDDFDSGVFPPARARIGRRRGLQGRAADGSASNGRRTHVPLLHHEAGASFQSTSGVRRA